MILPRESFGPEAENIVVSLGDAAWGDCLMNGRSGYELYCGLCKCENSREHMLSPEHERELEFAAQFESAGGVLTPDSAVVILNCLRRCCERESCARDC